MFDRQALGHAFLDEVSPFYRFTGGLGEGHRIRRGAVRQAKLLQPGPCFLDIAADGALGAGGGVVDRDASSRGQEQGRPA